MRGVKKGGADKQARNGTHRPASDFESNSSPIRFRKGAGPISDQIDSCSRPSLTKSSTEEQSNERTNERMQADASDDKQVRISRISLYSLLTVIPRAAARKPFSEVANVGRGALAVIRGPCVLSFPNPHAPAAGPVVQYDARRH